MERIYLFLPSLVAIATIAGLAWLYVHTQQRRFGKENLRDPTWLLANHQHVQKKLGVAVLLVWAPAAEELLFRAPLIIGFGSMSEPYAWEGLILSTIAFVLIHHMRIAPAQSECLAAWKKGEMPVSPPVAWHRRLAITFFTGCMSMLAGYYGVEYQSVWVSVGIHALWNLVVPTLAPILLLLMLVGSDSIREHIAARKNRNNLSA